MKKLQSTPKITLATLKSFIKRNSGKLFVKVHSSFSGMTDCVETVDSNWKLVEPGKEIGHGGVWCVGRSNDYFTLFQTSEYVGINVYNCCGSGTIVVKVN